MKFHAFILDLNVRIALLLIMPCVFAGCARDHKPENQLTQNAGEMAAELAPINAELDALPQAMSLAKLTTGTEILLTRDTATGREHATVGNSMLAEADRIELEADHQTLRLEGDAAMRLVRADGKETLLQAPTMQFALRGATVRDERSTPAVAPEL